LLERVEAESFRLDCPSFADELVGREAVEGLESSGEVVGGDEVVEMPGELVVGCVVIPLNGRFLDCAVHAFDLTIIRYVIRRRLVARLFPKGRRRYGEPIRDTGRREHEGAGRPPIDSGLRARARYMAAPCDFPGCAVSADQ
jgi:hypothetical protein